MDEYQNNFGMGQKPILMYPTELSETMRNYFISNKGPLPAYYRYLYDNMTSPEMLEDYIDVGSFVDYILHTELSLNQDAYSRSVYFYKDRDAPITAGPVWDFNLAYGLGSRSTQKSWLFLNSVAWKRLRCNYKFVAILLQRWEMLRKGAWSDVAIETFVHLSSLPITTMLKQCEDWKSEEVDCAYVSPGNAGTFQDALDVMLTSVTQRAAWMDAHITELYSTLNNTLCGAAGPLPATNCAADGNDTGCFENPMEYANRIELPAIREPFSGPACKRTNSDTTILEMDTVSVDPCWSSVGTSVMASYITPFCNGHGTCPSGIGATCKCNNNATTSTCLMAPKMQKAPTQTTDSSSWNVSWTAIFGFGFVAIILIIVKKKKGKGTWTDTITTVNEKTPLTSSRQLV